MSIGGTIGLLVMGMLAIVIAIPVLLVTFAVVAGVGLAMRAIGLPETLTSLVMLLGFVGGLAVLFVILLRITRRLPRGVRSTFLELDDQQPTPRDPTPTLEHDSAPDPTTLHERIRAADDHLRRP